jgi:hypothetical protein
MAKVYMMEFTDKVTGKQFHKFGYTQHTDALKRFSNTSYNDFNIRCVASIPGSLEQVQLMEHFFLAAYPKNIWLEDYLGDERNWSSFSGITEIVKLSDEQKKHATSTFYNLKQRVNAVQPSRLVNNPPPPLETDS